MRVRFQMRFAIVSTAFACSAARSDPTPIVVAKTHAPAATTTKLQTSAVGGIVVGKAANASRVVSVKILTSIDSTGASSDRPVRARRDQQVTLHAAIAIDRDRQRVWYGDVAAAVIDGKRVTLAPLSDAPRIELRWNRIEPAVASMTNGDGPDFRFARIDYRATPIAGDQPSITADVRPTLTPDHGHGVGTMRYQLVALQGDRVIATPGPEARRGSGSGGLTDAVMRVSIRRDDTYLGYLTEMYGQPYIWASAGVSVKNHQSERLEGSDCADFVVYGMRRMGKSLAYTWTGELPKVTKQLAAGARDADGIYRDAKGKPLPFTAVGDILLWPRHVAALAEDRGTIGVLDETDLVMHTNFDSPKEATIADTGYADMPLQIRRFSK